MLQPGDIGRDKSSPMDSKELDIAFPENQVQEMKMAFKNGDLLQAADNIKKSLVDLNGIPLNIAVTGDSGSGKSTFINVIRGLGDEDEGSAWTGVVETTVVATPYSHPRHRNVTYWDLPGVGTVSLTPTQYQELVDFNRFDFFFIITSHRFKDCHVQLARAINSAGKKFYFVRSKVDVDLYAASRLQRSSYNEEKILGEIRSNCIEGLHKGGIVCPRVFLLSCLELEKYDYFLMQETLENELPSHKKHMFLLSLPNIYSQALESKKVTFRNQIWKHALVSAAKASIATRGIAPDQDLDLVVSIMKEYKEAFGLDQSSLNCLAKTFDIGVHDLMSVIRNQVVLQEITPHLVVNLMRRREFMSASQMVTKYVARSVPFIVSIAAGGVAFGTTYWVLYSFLKDVAVDAERVLSRALESTQ